MQYKIVDVQFSCQNMLSSKIENAIITNNYQTTINESEAFSNLKI